MMQRVFLLDDEVERAAQLVESLNDSSLLEIEVSSDPERLYDGARYGEIELVLLDLGKEEPTGINLNYGESILIQMRRRGIDLPVIVFTQYPLTVQAKAHLREQYGVMDFVSKIAPEEILHKSIEETLKLDLGSARWKVVEDRVLVCIVAFDQKRFTVTIEVPAWPVARQIVVPLGSALFDDFRTDVLYHLNGGVSNINPLVCYGYARLEVQDERQLALRIDRIAGRLPSLDNIELNSLFRDVPDTPEGDDGRRADNQGER